MYMFTHILPHSLTCVSECLSVKLLRTNQSLDELNRSGGAGPHY